MQLYDHTYLFEQIQNLLELTCLILEGQNKTFESLKSKKQDLSFKCHEKSFQSAVGIQMISKDILKAVELYTESEGDNNAAFGSPIHKFTILMLCGTYFCSQLNDMVMPVSLSNKQ